MTTPRPPAAPAATAAAPTLVRTRAELAAALAGLAGPPVLVPTMGALHAGHGALLAAAGAGSVVSVFVNPLQFGPGEDLDRYPRSLAADLELAGRHRAAVVFAPSVEQMYPQGTPQVTVHAGPVGEVLEGAARPGHFDGVLTVVAKLFALVRPARAVFGEKDAQQLHLVRRMCRDLDLGVAVQEVVTVRDPDGLARSSRNRYLSAADRQAALAIPAALRTGSLPAARALLASAPGLTLEYAELVDPDTFLPTQGPAGRLVVAARVGSTRLIDTALLPRDSR